MLQEPLRERNSLDSSPVHKLFGNFQLVEQLSVHRATFNIFCHSHGPATSKAIKKCRIQLVSRIYLSNLLALLLGSTCFYEKVPRRNKRLY